MTRHEFDRGIGPVARFQLSAASAAVALDLQANMRVRWVKDDFVVAEQDKYAHRVRHGNEMAIKLHLREALTTEMVLLAPSLVLRRLAGENDDRLG